MIKIAIIGTGGIAPAHIDGILPFPDRCKIVALVDIYPEKAEAIKKRYNLEEAQVFDSHTALLQSNLEFDLAHVCTPPYVHMSISVDMMDAKKNVIVEKPMATCLAECDQMIDAASRNGVTLACIAQNRFRNSIYKLKKTLDSGIAGKLRCAHINSLWWRAHSYYDLWWRGLWEKEGGGCTLNHAVHHIDMLNWIQDDMPVYVSSMLANVMHDNSEVEDLSLSNLKYADNSVAQIMASVVHHGEEQGLVFQCEKAKIAAPWDVYASKPKPNGFAEGRDDILEQELKDFYNAIPDLEYEGHTGEIDNVLTAIENGTAPMITGIDGRRTVELITAIYKSGFTGQQVPLPISKDDELYNFSGIIKNAIHFYEKTSSVENFEASEITTGNY